MSRYFGVVGGCSGSYAILVENDARNVVIADDDKGGMDWRESRTHGDPGGGIQRLKDRIAAQICGPLSYDAAAVAISGADCRYWPWFHRLSLKHAGFEESKTEISSLAEADYWGAFRGRPGILIRSGHGSSCFGRNGEGGATLVGGWGSIVGDHGSASWLGQQTLDAFCRVLDLRAGPEERAFVNEYLASDEARTPMEVIENIERERFYIGGFGVRKELFSIGVKAMRMAELGDVHAESLTAKALNYLSECAFAVYRGIQEPADIPLALAGSTFSHSPKFSHALVEKISEHLPVAEVLASADESVFWSIAGVAILVINRFERDNEAWISNLMKTMRSAKGA
jgi:N-acetylglucosamine kinase-like BadF-type ATPase